MKKILAELKNETPEGLQKRLADTRQELSEKRARVRLNQEKKTSEVGRLKKTIAWILTLLQNANT